MAGSAVYNYATFLSKVQNYAQPSDTKHVW